ncbi:MAG: hypothetical protein WA364_23205 [Candidatus Nitrosopolaris sp.]
MNEISSDPRSIGGIELPAYNEWNIDAICANCNKRFKSMRSVSMHLKMTAARHTVNIIDHRNYDKKTGLKLMNTSKRPVVVV